MFQAVATQKGRTEDFKVSTYLLALAISGIVTTIAGLAVDNTLRFFGVGISQWVDAVWSGLSGTLFSIPIAPALWRLGLYTLPQYILGALGIFVPTTLLSVVFLSQVYDISISLPNLDESSFESQHFAINAYVRVIRSAFLFPIFLLTFAVVFHGFFKMKPYDWGKRRASDA